MVVENKILLIKPLSYYLLPHRNDRMLNENEPGNHAQALALAARTHGCAAHIVMPRISTPAKIAATQALGADVVFSGSTAAEREDVVRGVLERTGGVLVPPYDHEDIILGQGTVGVELEGQVRELLAGQEGEEEEREPGDDGERRRRRRRRKRERRQGQVLDAVVAPLGGGGLLSGLATAMEGTGTRVFGAEPRFQGADDGRRGLARGERVTSVSSLTIADGLRTPVGVLPWSVISDKEKVQGVFAVSEEQIKAAMRLVMERMKLLVEPSAVVGLAVVLYDEEFRRLVETEAGEEGWDVGIVLSGGNTTVEAVGGLFATAAGIAGATGATPKVEREEGKMGLGGERVAENVAG